MVAALAAQGWALPDAQANFVWFALGELTADFAAACEAAGLTVRPYGSDGARATIGEREANDRLIEVAGEFLAAHHAWPDPYPHRPIGHAGRAARRRPGVDQ